VNTRKLSNSARFSAQHGHDDKSSVLLCITRPASFRRPLLSVHVSVRVCRQLWC